ncbi:hypothetical protein CRENBAI_003716 [Crenichthys baileyi]|uniref:Secreted protein n=1 Tax=Crenichthys baileyi TaxID=28760 RepID=A0AAV9SFD4_9TELE
MYATLLRLCLGLMRVTLKTVVAHKENLCFVWSERFGSTTERISNAVKILLSCKIKIKLILSDNHQSLDANFSTTAENVLQGQRRERARRGKDKGMFACLGNLM